MPEDNFEVYNIDIPVNDDSPRNAETIFDDHLDEVDDDQQEESDSEPQQQIQNRNTSNQSEEDEVDMQLIQRIKMGMQTQDKLLDESPMHSGSRKQEEEGLINDLKDQEIDNDDNISLDSTDKLANEINQINEQSIEQLKNEDAEQALETLKRAE